MEKEAPRILKKEICKKGKNTLAESELGNKKPNPKWQMSYFALILY